MYQKSVLPNGIRIVTERIPHVRSVALGFWFGVGARNENDHNNGISHLIEHLMFKGTEKRTAREIAEAFDSAGGQLNAYTSKEYTTYYARVLDKHLPMATEIMADMLLNSKFAPGDLQKEKGVVLEEIKMYEDSPDEIIHDLFTQAILDQHPLGRNILGSSETVSGLSREDIKSYLSQFYTADNLVVAAAGNTTHEEVVSEISKYFGGLSGKTVMAEDHEAATEPRTSIRKKETEQVHLCVGSKGLRRSDPRKYALFTADVIIGGGMSSRLFQELREERGLVYSTYSYHVLYRDTGLFAVYAGTSPQNATQVVDLIKSEFGKLVAEGVDKTEFERAKEQLKGSLMLSLESTAGRMSRIAKSELFFDRYDSPDELVAKIDAVKLDEINGLCAELLDPDHLTLAAIGPWSPDETSGEITPVPVEAAAGRSGDTEP